VTQEKTPFEIAVEVMEDGQLREHAQLADDGLSPLTRESIPYYLSWARCDIALAVVLLNFVEKRARTTNRYRGCPDHC